MKIHCQETRHCSCLSVNRTIVRSYDTKQMIQALESTRNSYVWTFEQIHNIVAKHWTTNIYILRLILTLIVVQGELDQHFSFILVTLLKIYYDSSSNTTKVITLLGRPYLLIAKPFSTHFQIQFLAESPILTS